MTDDMDGVQSHTAAGASGAYKSAWAQFWRGAFLKLSGILKARIEKLDSWLVITWAGITAHPFAAVFIAFLVSLAIVTSPLWSESIRALLVGEGKDVSTIDVVNKIGLLLGGVVGFTLTIWRVWCVDRQTKINDRIHVTDRFLKASEQLGSPEMAVRLGGIFSLWAAGRDTEVESERYAVLDILCAFIRKPTKDGVELLEVKGGGVDSLPEATTNVEKSDEKNLLRIDVDSALKLLIRGTDDFFTAGKYVVDISWASIRFCSIKDASFRNCNLDCSDVSSSSIVSSDFEKSSCNKTKFNDTLFIGSIFRESQFIKANFKSAQHYSSVLTKANFRSCMFDDADFVACDFCKATINFLEVKNIKIIRSKLESILLNNCKFYNSSFENSDFSKSIFESVFTTDTIFTSANLSKLSCTSSDFISANFCGADLSFGHFLDSNFLVSDFNNCTFSNTILDNCIFAPKSVIGAKFNGTDFSKALALDIKEGADTGALYYLIRVPRLSVERAKSIGFEVRPVRRSDLSGAATVEGAIFAED